MSQPLCWILGAGGLLGRALGAGLASSRQHFRLAQPLAWDDPPRLQAQLEAACQRFAAQACAHPRWELCWAAGTGTLHSPETALLREEAALAHLLRVLARQPALVERPGLVMLASSTGALYGHQTGGLVDEDTPIAPTTAYGHAKARQEAQLLQAAASWPGQRLSVLAARLSSLYGTDQAAHKAQGLLTQIARRTLRHQVVHIYVPLDTLRDYLFAPDAAAHLRQAMDQLADQPGALVRIFAAERSTSVAELLRTFGHVMHRPPRVVTSVCAASLAYARQVRFRSRLPLAGPTPVRTPLPAGISALVAAERLRYQQAGP
ncbi:NAD-dependent epimerase/dehydratase family protein [Ideonella livida]|uniref:NAD(P)-dependent oxidoreductase n=1 Tax=Ideonella livida TaxID=2707176 RepID=A0A7C9PJS4_9BURK|nr:NAD(P)-dependent oxidoreductase [Ideonella livida]NDY92754.1 NAD(P)-dependent oxidoreductase [Ideonella livida]